MEPITKMKKIKGLEAISWPLTSKTCMNLNVEGLKTQMEWIQTLKPGLLMMEDTEKIKSAS